MLANHTSRQLLSKPKFRILLVVIVLALSCIMYLILFTGRSEEHPSDIEDSAYNPTIIPAEFSVDITNPYFTLPVGRTFVYESQTVEGTERIEIQITGETRTIMGVITAVYWDRVWVNSELEEDTRDYLAQHENGDVWYFGEDVDNYQDGSIHDHEGSWIAGEDGAKPGIWIKANPEIGDTYRQEYYEGEAEDMGTVLDIGISVTTQLQTYSDCVQIKDWDLLDPDSEEYKYYCTDIGTLVLEEEIGTGTRVELVEVK